jgi:restriction system protein
MARRRKEDSALTALFEITGSLPPLVGVLLAAGSYFFFHAWAGRAFTPPVGGPIAQGIASNVVHGLVLGAQYVLPAIFALGALSSILQRARGRPGPQVTPAPATAEDDAESAGPRNEHDIYRIWAGDWDEAPAPAHGVDTSAWSLALLRAVEWKRFEELCAAYFRMLGFSTRLAAPGPDGGIDIHLVPEGSDTPGVLVQCKAWNTYDIGVKAIRELLGVMTAQKVGEGVFVTTGRFTQPARDFALGKEIMLIDGPDLLDKILALRHQQQAELLAVATAGDFTRPTCPSCGVKMVRRIARASGDPFWGCENFPGCRTTLRIAAEAA